MNATQLTQRQAVNGALLEKVITSNDLAGLTPVEKVQHIKNVCESLGLNPLTKPIQLLKFQGKEIAYFTKDATEQLRKNNRVSITKVENKIIDGIYVVTVYASTPDGRNDASTGATSIQGLKGDALCNAILKAETKAKRRVTLSICGLGFIDESEAESIPNSTKIDVYQNQTEVKQIESKQEESDISDILLALSQCNTLDELEVEYKTFYKHLCMQRDPSGIKRLIDAKDERKKQIEHDNNNNIGSNNS